MRFNDEELQELFDLCIGFNSNYDYACEEGIYNHRPDAEKKDLENLETANNNFIAAVENKIYPAVDPNEIHELKKKIEKLQEVADKYADLYAKYLSLKQRDRQEPCEWEKAWVKGYTTQKNLSFLSDLAQQEMDHAIEFNFCPMCGRRLEEK